nr:PREDICTED: uncharacterized protein LOC105671632 [Linepithema humile]
MYDMQFLYVFSLIILTVALDISRDNVDESIESETNDTTEDYDIVTKKYKIFSILLMTVIIMFVFFRCCLQELCRHRTAIHLRPIKRETFDESRLEQNNQSRIEHRVNDSNEHTEERRHRCRTNERKEECKYDERDKRMQENRNKDRDDAGFIWNNLESMDDDMIDNRNLIFEPRPKRVCFLAQTSKVHSPKINNSGSNAGISVEIVKLNHKAQVHAKEENNN